MTNSEVAAAMGRLSQAQRLRVQRAMAQANATWRQTTQQTACGGARKLPLETLAAAILAAQEVALIVERVMPWQT